MRDISIMNVPNGGFLIADFREGKSIAALSNSDDLIDWLIKQFNLPAKNADEMIAALEAISPEPEQDGFITKEPEWIPWAGESDRPQGSIRVKVKYRNGNTDADEAWKFFWNHDGRGDDIVRYRVLS